MPFKSQSQARFMFSQHPKIAKEFAAHIPSIKSLPQHAHAMHDLHMARLKKHKRKTAIV